MIPKPPAPLDPIGVAAWHRIVPKLIGRGLWDELYYSSVPITCGSISLHTRLCDAAADDGILPSTRRSTTSTTCTCYRRFKSISPCNSGTSIRYNASLGDRMTGLAMG